MHFLIINTIHKRSIKNVHTVAYQFREAKGYCSKFECLCVCVWVHRKYALFLCYELDVDIITSDHAMRVDVNVCVRARLHTYTTLNSVNLFYLTLKVVVIHSAGSYF